MGLIENYLKTNHHFPIFETAILGVYPVFRNTHIAIYRENVSSKPGFQDSNP
jgi:hypothetical protein